VSDKKIRQGKNGIENSLVVAKFVIDKKTKKSHEQIYKILRTTDYQTSIEFFR